MSDDWKIVLDNESKKGNFSHIKFLNEFEKIIPGPNRDAKRKRITRYMENSKIKKPEKELCVQETSILEAPEVNLNVKTNTITFGLIGDTHFNSKYVQLTYLNNFYDMCVAQGINDVYHVGDIDEGEMMRPGHAYENYKQGADDHILEIVKNYPYRRCYNTFHYR